MKSLRNLVALSVVGLFCQQFFGQNTVTLYPDIDATVSSLSPTANYGTYPTFIASRWTNGAQFTLRSYMKFDLASIPSNAIIVSASLTLYGVDHNPLSGSNESYLQKVTASWDEQTITWNNAPAADTTGQKYLPGSTSATQNYTIDMKSWIQQWVNGTPNYGFLMKLKTETIYRKLSFNSSDCADPTKRPKLVIQYKPIMTFTIGNGTISQTDISTPFSFVPKNKKVQYLYLASELAAQGMTAGNIYSIAFDITTAGVSLSNIPVSLKNTTSNQLTSFQSGLTVVYTGSYTAGTGWRKISFLTPFYWNGTSNIAVQVCYAESGTGNPPGNLSYAHCSSTSSILTRGAYTTNDTPLGCDLGDGNNPTTSTTRPNIKFVSDCSLVPYISPVSISSYTYAVDSSKNYIHTITPKIPYSSVSDTGLRNPYQISEQVNYFDGLGRPLQSIDIESSPTGASIIQPSIYDRFGRDSLKYMPFGNTTKGQYLSGAVSLQSDYYNPSTSTVDIAKSYTPYALTIYESSPLNRVIEQGAAGDDWQPYSAGIPNSGHTVMCDHLTNTSHELFWKDYGTFFESEYYYYEPGQLYLTKTYNENWSDADGDLNTTQEYKDKEGKVVLKRTFVKVGTTTTALSTYYVYDDFNLLIGVIPPLAYEKRYSGDVIVIQSDDYFNLCYHYKYDARHRMIKKQVPGADSICMIYDKRDRLVASQDGVQRKKTPYKEWSFTKYDAVNRPVISGTYQSNSSRVTLQTQVNSFTGDSLFEIRSTGGNTLQGYTYRSFPIVSDDSYYLNVTYYDDYSGIDQLGGYRRYSDNEFDAQAFNQTCGKVTGTRIKVITSGCQVNNNFLKTVNYYDKYGRIIETISENHLGGRDILATKYSFIGEVLKTMQKDSLGSSNYTYLIKRFIYDHRSHLLELWCKVGTTLPISDSILISGNRYNELGQLKKKGLHGIKNGGYQQSLDYSYNIRGWLTNINNLSNLSAEDDLFAMQLLYNTIIPNLNLTVDAQYNGNISGMKWKAKGMNCIAGYGYGYDQLSRITKANYGDSTSSWVKSQNKFNVRGISYDSNGNILTMNSDGAGFKIDSLTYTYYTNSNQLMNVDDRTGGSYESYGFSDGTTSGSTGIEYTYDMNGNLLKDDNKKFKIQYNQLNLPKYLYSYSGSDTTAGIEYLYTATGEKLGKIIYNTGHVKNDATTFHYLGNFVYDNTNALKYILFEEGRIMKVASNYVYEYFIKDHLGNTRAAFDAGTGGFTLVQRNDYYPFGMILDASIPNNDNKYLYNGKELQDDNLNSTAINWYDYGARFYDPQIGRFHVQDRFAEKHYPLSPYQYANNNPIYNNDVNGDWFSGAIEWLGKIDDYFKRQITAKQNQIQRNEVRRINAERAGNDKKAARLENRIQRQEVKLATLNTKYSHVQGEINAMASSPQEYHINASFGNLGAVGFDWNTKAVNINFNSASMNSLANFSHELKHGFQFQTGKISLIPNTNAGGDLYDMQDEVEAYQRMQAFGMYSGQNIDAAWVTAHGKEGGAYQSIQNKTNQITTSTPTANFPGAETYGNQIEYQINSAGRSSTIPRQVIINWQFMYEK